MRTRRRSVFALVASVVVGSAALSGGLLLGKQDVTETKQQVATLKVTKTYADANSAPLVPEHLYQRILDIGRLPAGAEILSAFVHNRGIEEDVVAFLHAYDGSFVTGSDVFNFEFALGADVVFDGFRRDGARQAAVFSMEDPVDLKAVLNLPTSPLTAGSFDVYVNYIQH
jgi:hypothetical protein